MPWINPIAIQLGPLAIHWYGLMYAITFASAYLIFQYSSFGKELPLTANQKDNLLANLILAIILGGRLGYIIFYNFPYYLNNPAKILALWEGGLSFHGGVIGVIIALIIYGKLHKKSTNQKPLNFWLISDLACLIAPLGIFLGRIGNFINGELYGRIATTTSSNPLQTLLNQTCLNFPTDPTNCRYPSQLFESFGEGFLLLIIMLLVSKKFYAKHPGIMTAIFLTLYGLIRFLIEFTRAPDSQIGFLWGGATLGQILSLLTSLLGLSIFIYFKKSKNHQNTQN